jgi:outer membrane receptor protein involved in Fe transport
MAASAYAQAPAQIEEIVVTGSRIPRPDLQSASPVTVVNADAFRVAAETNVVRILNELPAFTPTRSPANNGATSFTGSFASLRGLGRNRTLVLVNGRRYINTISDGGVDLSTIPPELIERVEVVTGGASATYGSDAVGGVINFIMKDELDGVEMNVQAGRTGRGETTNSRISITGGQKFADDLGSAYFHASYDNSDPITADGRSFIDPVLVNDGRGGFTPLVSERVPSGSALAPVGTGTQRAFFRNGELFSAPGVANALPTTSFFSDAPFARLQLPAEKTTIAAGFKYNISEGVRLYSEGIFVKEDIRTVFAPIGLGLAGERLNLANPFLGPLTRASLAPRADAQGFFTIPGLARRFSEVGDRRTFTDRNSYRFVLGATVQLPADWSLDVNMNYAESTFEVRQRNIINVVRLSQALDVVAGPTGAPQCRVTSGGCVPANIFGANGLTAAAADFVRGEANLDGRNADTVIQAIFTGDIYDLPAGTVGFSGGIEYKKGEASENPDDAFLLNVTSSGQFAVLNGKSDSWEAFGEVNVPLLRDMPFVDYLGFEGGVRYTKLQPGGDTFTYKALLEWAALPQVKFRGGLQRALRAPNAFELGAGDQNDDILSTDPCFTGAALTGSLRAACLATGFPTALANTGATGANFVYRATFFGNPNLEPERADSLTLGVVFQDIGVPNLSFTADYYDINIKSAIGSVSLANLLNYCFLAGTSGSSPLCAVFTRNATTGAVTRIVRSQQNTGKLVIRGVDLGVVYSRAVPGVLFDEDGAIRIASNAVYSLENTRVPFANAPSVKFECEGLYGPNCTGGPFPKWRANTRFSWQEGPLTLGLTWTWVGKVGDDARIYAPASFTNLAVKGLPAQQYFDLTGVYALSNGVTLRGGVENLFDNEPPIPGRDRALTSTEISGVPGLYDHIGRRYFAGASVRF